MFYKLNPETKETIKVEKFDEAGFEYEDRVVDRYECGGILLSTVFLCIDHNFSGDKPLLFETMLFLNGVDIAQKRYSTWEEAEQGHKYIQVAYIEEELVPKLRKTQSYRRLKRWLAESGINRSQRKLRGLIPATRHAILKGAY